VLPSIKLSRLDINGDRNGQRWSADIDTPPSVDVSQTQTIQKSLTVIVEKQCRPGLAEGPVMRRSFEGKNSLVCC